jgi:hypothetical protein
MRPLLTPFLIPRDHNSYTRAEQPNRISAWYCFNVRRELLVGVCRAGETYFDLMLTIQGIGVAMGGLLGYAIGTIKGALVSWKYEYVWRSFSEPGLA